MAEITRRSATFMFSTAEVRWFYAGPIPPAVLRWFHGSTPVLLSPLRRVDYYMRLVEDGDGLGIKLREGRLEIKKRSRQYSTVHFHEQVAGQVEGWHKWSFELSEADRDPMDIEILSPFWIGVEKERQLCTFQLNHDHTIVAASVSSPLDQGCNLELTRVAVQGSNWWSLGLEAFGDSSTLYDNLLLVAKHLFAAVKPPQLDAGNSSGYPHWLKLASPLTLP